MIDEKLKQKLILNLLGFDGQIEQTKKVGSELDQRFVGKKVMVRTYSAGVHFGELVEKCGQQAILKNSKRVWSWVKAASLSQLAMEGSKHISGCKITMAVGEVLLDRVVEIIPMNLSAYNQLMEAEEWKI